MGLKGNPPHAWYAVRAFREIHRGTPELSAPPRKAREIAALALIVTSLRPGDCRWWRCPPRSNPRKPVIEWAVPELANFGLRAEADSAIPGSILVTPVHPLASPMLPPKRALADAQPAPFTTEGTRIRVLVPFERSAQPHDAGARIVRRPRFPAGRADARHRGLNHPPVLLSLTLPEGGIETFEARPGDAAPYQTAAVPRSTPPTPGAASSNSKTPGLRQTPGRPAGQVVNPVATPRIQFRYKGDPMAIVSLAFGSTAFTFSEVYNTHVRFGNGAAAPMDNTWRVWTGIPTDSGGQLPLAQRTTVPPAPLRFASRGDSDQTGLHSTLCIDDSLRPAWPQPSLRLQGRLRRPHTVAEWSTQSCRPRRFRQPPRSGSAPRSPGSRQNGEVIEPDIAKIPTASTLLVRAATGSRLVAPRGLPFIADRTQPQVTHAINAVRTTTAAAHSR
jgi:hypothetical protein